MSQETLFAPLYTFLRNRCQFEVTSESISSGRVRFTGRVPLGAPTTTVWLSLVDAALEAAEGADWSVDISKQYFRRGGLYFTWRVILQSKELTKEGAFDIYQAWMQTYLSHNPESVQVTEAPLYGSALRNQGANGKGAVPIEEAVVGAQFRPRSAR